MNPNYIPYPVRGEIIKVQESFKNGRKIIRYLCSAEMPNGSRQLIPNVEMVSSFGGIGDYTQRRARSTTDDGNKLPPQTNDEAMAHTIGDRVVISFLGGSIQFPVITGFLQHPEQTNEFDKDPVSLDPQAVLQYLGIRIEVSDTGAIRFIKKGAPKVKYTAGSAVPSLPAVGPSSGIKGNDNKALEPAADTEVVLWEMLDEGVFRLRDSDGQMIELDRSSGTITLSNGGLKSTEDASSVSPGSSDAESIIFDNSANSIEITTRKLLSINSLDAREDVTEGDYSHDITGNSSVTIGGDETLSIDGNQEVSIQQDAKLSIKGGYKASVMGKTELSSTGGIELEAAGAKLKLANGKVGLGGPAAELLDLLDQQLDAIIQNAPTFVSTAVGPGVLNPAVVATLTQIKTLLGTIKGGI